MFSGRFLQSETFDATLCESDLGKRCLRFFLVLTLGGFSDISKSVDAAQPFAAHISSFLAKPLINVSDITFRTSDSDIEYAVHRFILSVRSEYFSNKLSGVWSSDSLVRLEDGIQGTAFSFILKYIYLFDQSLPLKDDLMMENLEVAARKLQLVGLLEHIKDATGKREQGVKAQAQRRRDQRELDMWKARLQFEVFLEKKVIGSKVELGSEDPDLSAADIENMCQPDASPDVILEVELADGGAVYYPCHKAMLVRSDYYLAMFTSPFMEGEPDNIPIIQLPVDSIEVAELVLTYIYTDKTDVPVDRAMEVLYAADMLLLERLKTFSAISITNCGNNLPESLSVFEILRAGWTLRIDRLEKYVAKYIANNLDGYIAMPEFRDIVIESAQRIQARQETDTIELIDDVRFYLAKKYGIIFEDEQDAENTKSIGKVYDEYLDISQYERDYNSKLDQIDDLLENLHLDA